MTHLFDDYYFRTATVEEFGPFFKENRSKIFTDSLTIDIDDWMSDEEKQKQKSLDSKIKDRIFLRLFIMKGEEIIGWHTGRQVEAETYNMSNTGLFEEHRGKGIYTALLLKLLEQFKEMGFQKVASRHHGSNSAILVPKLKAGFVITGFDIDERYGLLIILTYIFNEKRMNAYKFRVGAMRPDQEIGKFL